MDTSFTVKIPNKHIVFFDGYCNLCNSSVDFIIQRDPKINFIFESLQSETAKDLLDVNLTEKVEYIIVRKSNGEILTKSKAVFFVIKYLKSPVRLLHYFNFLPSFLTDFFYKLIARNRYRLFGKKSTCRMPTAEDQLRFLEAYQNV